MTNLQPLMSSNRSDWNTPECVLERVRKLGPIGLDPCSNGNSIVRAKVAWSVADGRDGLRERWASESDIVYVNPPYGRDIGEWTRRCMNAGGLGEEVVALLPARTDTLWWYQHVRSAQAVCFWRGRLTFLGAKAPAPFPSAVAYWGPRRFEFAAAFDTAGWVVLP